MRPRGGAFGGNYLTSTELFGVLASEPHNVPLKDIPDLDRWQTVAVYFVARDKRGNVIASGRDAPRQSERAGFYAFWQARCLPAWRVDALWREITAERARAKEARKAKRTAGGGEAKPRAKRQPKRIGRSRG